MSFRQDINLYRSEKVAQLAAHSLHYMMEEFRIHRNFAGTNELRETMFIDLFCEYLKWIGFLERKLLISRWVHLAQRHAKVRTMPLAPSIAKTLEEIGTTQQALEEVSSSNRPRLSTSGRIAQVRKGVFLPLLCTAFTTLSCLSLKPLMQWDEGMAFFTTNLTYSFVAASLALNFSFGLWLLLRPTGWRP